MTADRESPDVDPEDFLRALLKISPEDAEKARKDAAKATQRKPNSGDQDDE